MNDLTDSDPDQNQPLLPKGICPLPWLHFSVNTDTSIRVCCNTDHGGHIRDENNNPIYLSNLASVDQAFNGPFMKRFRLAMANGEKPTFCNNCYRVEDNGGVSLRNIYLKQYEESFHHLLEATGEDGTATNEISFLDLSLSNHCNLKCRMCGPTSSYALHDDFESLKIHFSKEHTQRAHLDWQDDSHLTMIFSKILPGLKEVLTTGGEPFLSRLHLKLLELAVQNGSSRNIVLRYHSNISVLPPRLLELWSEFKAIEIHISVEGYGDINDYIRFPLKWSVFRKNFESLIELKKRLPLWLEIHTCFQAYNILRLPEFLDFLINYRDSLPAMPYFISLGNPSYLSASVLPSALKELAMEKIYRHLDRNISHYDEHFGQFNREKIEILLSHFKSLNHSIETEIQRHISWKKFMDYTSSFDRLRNQSILELLPEMKSFWKPGNAESDFNATV
ncbi:MAG: twitch domain-containing radical SAM protein [Bdellovibrionales bacterium]|nr:twitch domain-containing radical SAM protein [Bdellovibrionales bacterium]